MRNHSPIPSTLPVLGSLLPQGSRRRIALPTLGAVAALVMAAAACGSPPPPQTATTPTAKATASAPPREQIAAEATQQFSAALEAFLAHDKANDWSDESCKDTSKKFEDAASRQKGGKFPEATFNAGLSHQRCGDDKSARAKFEKTLQDDPNFHHARAQLALYKYKDNQNEDAVITELQQAVKDAKFQNVPALVNLALFQMQRDGSTRDQGCKDDMECSKQNLQRALAIDDSYMPAFNQLALYYFQHAKKRAGAIKSSQKGGRGRQIATNAAMGKRADVQQLELAALVCSQAIRKNPNDAPIHNTAGLIQNELGQVNSAVAEFATAAKLDAKFFEAQMNYAAVNLSFRGFGEAATAYKKALEMRNDYDAHLGNALALRGLINDSNYDAQVAAVQAELDACKKLDPNRPDAYYNEAILTDEYKAKAGGGKEKTIEALTKAKAIYQQFIEKAAGKPEYDGAIKASRGNGTDKDRGRMGDIDDKIAFINLEVKPEPGTPTPPPGGAAPPPGGAAPPPGGAPPPAKP